MISKPLDPLKMKPMTFQCLSLALAGFLLMANPLQAQQTSTSTTATSAEASKAFDPVEATKAWLNTVPAEKREKSDAYFEGGYWLLLWNFLLGAAISIFLLATRLSARLRDFAERTTNSRIVQVVIYAVGYVLIVALLGFAFTFYQLFLREHQYGFAPQTFGP